MTVYPPPVSEPSTDAPSETWVNETVTVEPPAVAVGVGPVGRVRAAPRPLAPMEPMVQAASAAPAETTTATTTTTRTVRRFTP